MSRQHWKQTAREGGGLSTQTQLETRRCGVDWEGWGSGGDVAVLSGGDRSNHARAQTTVAPSGRTRSRLCQRSLNSGISWTQHWRFGLCLHKRDRKHCKLFTGEHGVTVCLCVCRAQLCVCACVYKAMLWLLWNGLTRLWLRQHQHRDSGMCPYTNTQATHTGHVFNNTPAHRRTRTYARRRRFWCNFFVFSPWDFPFIDLKQRRPWTELKKWEWTTPSDTNLCSKPHYNLFLIVPSLWTLPRSWIAVISLCGGNQSHWMNKLNLLKVILKWY